MNYRRHAKNQLTLKKITKDNIYKVYRTPKRKIMQETLRIKMFFEVHDVNLSICISKHACNNSVQLNGVQKLAKLFAVEKLEVTNNKYGNIYLVSVN